MLIISPKAEWDIVEIVAHYKKIDNKLGNKFGTEIIHLLDNLFFEPLMYPVAYKNYRRAITKNFSYAVYYSVELNNDVVIEAILSQKISARMLKSRLG